MWEQFVATDLGADRLEQAKRTSELGSAFDFVPVVDRLLRIREIVGLADRPDVLAWLPEPVRGDVTDHTTATAELVREILTVSAEQGGAQRPSFINRATQESDWFTRTLAPYVGLATSAATNAELLDITARTRKAAAEAEQAVAAALEKLGAADGLLGSLRTAAANTGVANLSGLYRSQADAHAGQARSFLIAGAVAFVILVVSGWVLLHEPLPTTAGADPLVDYVRQLVPRVLLLGAIAYALRFALQNFRANRHLQVLNEQRRNALDTFPLLSAAASNDDTRNVLIAELVRAVFAATPTGFVADGTDRTIVEESTSVARDLFRR